MSTTDSIRDAFEAHWPNAAKERDGDTYDSTIWECRWEGWQAATEAAKATSVAPKKTKQSFENIEELVPLPEPLEINWPQLHSEALGCGVEDRGIRDRYEAAEYGWHDGVDKAIERTPEAIYDADQMREYGQVCAEAARHDMDGNHADDLRGMLMELQTEFDKQQSAFWLCSEKLAQVRREQQAELSDDRILELAEEDFGEQDDRNVKNESLLSFARKVQAARQPAPVAADSVDSDVPEALQLLSDIFDAWENGVDCYEDPEECAGFLGKAFQLDDEVFERCCVLLNRRNPPRNAALAATVAPVLSDEQILDIRNRIWEDVKADDEYDSSDISFARAILAATRSQP